MISEDPHTPYVVMGRTLSSDPACAPLRDMLSAVHPTGPKSWLNVEDAFLRAMEQFDDRVVDGTADAGAQRNGKGDFFNDLLPMVLENCSGVQLGVPSHLVLDRVLHRTCRDLQGLPGKEPTPLPGTPALTSVAEDLVEAGDAIDVEESSDD